MFFLDCHPGPFESTMSYMLYFRRLSSDAYRVLLIAQHHTSRVICLVETTRARSTFSSGNVTHAALRLPWHWRSRRHAEQGRFMVGFDFSFGVFIPLRKDTTGTRILPVGPDRVVPTALGSHELETPCLEASRCMEGFLISSAGRWENV